MDRTLVLIRHGQSDWNLKNLFTGWKDPALTPVGVEEARAAGRRLKALGVGFDTAFTSALSRAQHTTQLVLEEMGASALPVVKDARLNERDYGDLSGLNKNLRLHGDGRYRWHWDQRMMTDARADPKHMLEMLDAADWTDRIPTLLVRGMKSDIVTEEGVADLRRRIPHLEIADIRGAGHMVAGDRNDEFNAAVIDFRNQLEEASSREAATK